MFCPQCRSGFRDGFTHCDECDLDLVSTLPPEPDHTADYVPITTVQGQLQVGQVRSFLESNGIPTEVRGESARNVYGLTVDGLAAVEVLVPREQAAAAMDLLEKADHGDLVIDAEETE